MQIRRVVVRQVQMHLMAPFTTSFGTMTHRDFFLVEVGDADGVAGHAEVVCDSQPFYNEEDTATCGHMLRDFLVPMVLGQQLAHPSDVVHLTAAVRRNYIAKSGLESAVWDLYARRQGLSLAGGLGGVKDRIAVGVSIGIQDTIPGTLRLIEGYLAEGYRRIKVKIRPGWDVALVAEIRRAFGGIPLMADANSAYTLAHIPLLKELDQFGLMMIEQPLAHDDIVDHARVQRELQTPVCLDESICNLEDARKALDLGSCRIINIKTGRVGGLTEARAISEYCRERGVPVWCGGMLESGIGRAHNLALTALPGFTLPGDTSASKRYWHEDIVDPPVEMDADGTIPVPTGPGFGYSINWERVQRITSHMEEFRA